MIIQALCSCLFNNCALALHIIEKEGQTVPFFSALLSHMPKFKREFEIRRVLFGLTAIFRTQMDHLPQLIAQKQPELFKEVGSLAVKVFNERKDTLKENEDFLAKGMPELSDDDGYYSESDDEKEIQDTKDKLKGFVGDMDDDDEDDSDYEIEGDDNGLYDSNLDEVDELLHLKETVDAIH